LLKKGRGPEPAPLAHAAGHEAPNFSAGMIGPAIGRVGPNHSSAVAVRLGDYGIVGNVNPSAVEMDAVMAVLRFPINVADNRAVRERTTLPLARCEPVEPPMLRGLLLKSIPPLAAVVDAESDEEETRIPRVWQAPRSILCIPGFSKLDEGAAIVLAQLLRRRGYGASAEQCDAMSVAKFFSLVAGMRPQRAAQIASQQERTPRRRVLLTNKYGKGNRMTKLKLLAATAALATLLASPATARVYHHHHYYRHGYYNYYDPGPVGAAVGIAGAAIGTAGAIATAPFRGSYAYDPGYGPDPYYGRGW
jgi:hypothetical protein